MDRVPMCPSGRPRADNLLIGMRGRDGMVRTLVTPLRAGSDLAHRDAARTFRFAEPCAGAGCEHWALDRCGLIDALVTWTPPDPAADRVPRCGLRSTCRWFAQHGVAACDRCRYVTRERAESGRGASDVGPPG